MRMLLKVAAERTLCNNWSYSLLCADKTAKFACRVLQQSLCTVLTQNALEFMVYRLPAASVKITTLKHHPMHDVAAAAEHCMGR